VVLVTPLTLVEFSSGVMARLDTTAIWYRSILLPTDVRFAYRFAPNDNLVPYERDTNIVARLRIMQRDSMNPRIFDYGPFGQLSILELGDAPRDSLIHQRPGVARGHVTRVTLASRVLGHERTIWLYTPAGYRASANSRRYTTLVLSDGESYQSLIPAPTILDNLIAARAIGPVIAVFVDNPPAVREHDLNCDRRWDAFLVEEVIPWVDAHYRTLRDPRHRIVGGYSLGGLAAACTAIRHPATFGNVLAQSGSFYRAPSGEDPEWVSRELVRRPRMPIRFAISIGRYETAVIPSRDPSMLTASRHLRDVLVAKGYDVCYRELDSGHEHVAWRAVLGDALLCLAPGRSELARRHRWKPIERGNRAEAG